VNCKAGRIKHKKKRFPVILVGIIVILAINIGGCAVSKKQSNKELTIEDIAHNAKNSTRCTIYLIENDEYTPYLVLSDGYNGNCLLLREFLLDDPMRFNPNGLYSAYYENSEIDEYLNHNFINGLSNAISKKLIKSEVIITAKDSLGVCGTNTIIIERDVFLLSYSELGGIKSSTNIEEGKRLLYFNNNESRIAKYRSGEIGSWWLRTPNTWYDNVACGVSGDGVVGIGGVGGAGEDYINGIRPAFCIPKDTLIQEAEINGEKVYVIEE
jgi:hypothetical protein